MFQMLCISHKLYAISSLCKSVLAMYKVARKLFIAMLSWIRGNVKRGTRTLFCPRQQLHYTAECNIRKAFLAPVILCLTNYNTPCATERTQIWDIEDDPLKTWLHFCNCNPDNYVTFIHSLVLCKRLVTRQLIRPNALSLF